MALTAGTNLALAYRLRHAAGASERLVFAVLAIDTARVSSSSGIWG
jgi:hypothetical protein